MEEIFETLRKQIKGGFDQNNIIIILDNSISLTCKKHPIPRILNYLPRTRIQLQLPHKIQNSETKNTEPNRTRIPTTNQEPNPIQPNK